MFVLTFLIIRYRNQFAIYFGVRLYVSNLDDIHSSVFTIYESYFLRTVELAYAMQLFLKNEYRNMFNISTSMRV